MFHCCRSMLILLILQKKCVVGVEMSEESMLQIHSVFDSKLVGNLCTQSR